MENGVFINTYWYADTSKETTIIRTDQIKRFEHKSSGWTYIYLKNYQNDNSWCCSRLPIADICKAIACYESLLAQAQNPRVFHLTSSNLQTLSYMLDLTAETRIGVTELLRNPEEPGRIFETVYALDFEAQPQIPQTLPASRPRPDPYHV